jgi:hypothetical protein
MEVEIIPAFALSLHNWEKRPLCDTNKVEDKSKCIDPVTTFLTQRPCAVSINGIPYFKKVLPTTTKARE